MRSYSGRGMFGKECLAFESLEELLNAIRADASLPTNGWLSDAMGLGEIYYHPEVKFSRLDYVDPDDEDYSEQMVIKSCCADPSIRGGKCYNCGTWIEDD